jgi:putative aldouronate transport system permease protein
MALPAIQAKRPAHTGRAGAALRRIYKYRYLYLLMLPGLACVIVFSYFPMYGIQLAFKKFMYNLSIWKDPWVGFYHFEYLFRNKEFLHVIFNTVWISFWNLVWSFPLTIVLSLLINELRMQRFKRFTQSVLYMPHFISWIIIAGLVFSLFSVTNGAVNRTIVAAGGKPLVIIGNPNVFRVLLYSTNIWKGIGWGTIIYMAAIAGVDAQLYDAAVIDGAGRFKQCLHITIPSMQYAIVILLILDVGGLMNSNFDQIFNMISPATRPVGDVIDTYVYRMGVQNGKYDLATAVGLFKQVINCGLLFLTNWIVKKLGQEGFI